MFSACFLSDYSGNCVQGSIRELMDSIHPFVRDNAVLILTGISEATFYHIILAEPSEN